MAEYYYTNNPTSEHEERHFTSVFMGRTLAFETDAGVFSKQHIDPGSEILCKSLPELHGRVLDMGCGWGAMTVMALARFPALDVTMADVNERALDLAVRNVQKNGMQAKAVLSDGFERVEGEFDAVMTNPPIRAAPQIPQKVLPGQPRRAARRRAVSGHPQAAGRAERAQVFEGAVRRGRNHRARRRLLGDCMQKVSA